jgi:hypothetical protein
MKLTLSAISRRLLPHLTMVLSTDTTMPSRLLSIIPYVLYFHFQVEVLVTKFFFFEIVSIFLFVISSVEPMAASRNECLRSIMVYPPCLETFNFMELRKSISTLIHSDMTAYFDTTLIYLSILSTHLSQLHEHS